MNSHMKSKRPNKWSSNRVLRSGSLVGLVLLVLVSGSEAIVKQQQQQQQQRSDESQPQQQASAGQQSHHSSAFNNHQSQSLANSGQNSAQQSSQPTYSSSVSISSSSPSAGSVQPLSPSASSQAGASSGPLGALAAQSVPSSQTSAGNQQSGRDQLGYANYGASAAVSAGANQGSGPKSGYLDNMSAAASSPDQSYQAAASSVNMALANSGIFGPQSTGYSGSSSAQSAQGSQSGLSSQQSLNPLHYFYYPAKDSAANGAQAKQSVDVMSNSASNNYQSMSYPSYADQLNSALSNMGSGPEAAASGQDPSYLPQPASLGHNVDGNSAQSNSMYGGQQQAQHQQQQANQQQANQHQSYAGDLGSYSSNLSPSQGQQGSPVGSQQNSAGSISFSGPSTGNGPASDFMNSHMSGPGHQQTQGLSAYQSNLYNQMGDLSTSNFGNNAGGISSVASYMSPNQQHQQAGSHDLFSGSAGSLLGASSQQFNPAASQLSPAAVSPPIGGQQGSQGSSALGSASSLFGAASSLFGQQANGASNSGNSANNLFSNQHYLNSFLTPQQYNQLAGQQQQSQMGSSEQQLAAASSPSSSSSVTSSNSSKRFGISSFIMPMLALAGLSLLIPTMSNIGTAVGRKKRSIEDRASASNRQQQIAFDPLVNGAAQLAKEASIGEYMDKIERYYSIYKNAVENDDCLNRLICEFGDAVKDITGKSAVVT